ncbi:MAG: response regulator [Pseudomonadota bacterium]
MQEVTSITDVIIAIGDKNAGDAVHTILRGDDRFRSMRVTSANTLIAKLQHESWGCLVACEDFDGVNHHGLVSLIRSGDICPMALPIVIITSDDNGDNDRFSKSYAVTTLQYKNIDQIADKIRVAIKDTPKPRLLIIEDDPDYLDQIRDYLSGAFSVQTALSGQTGLDIFEKESADIIITDYMMPGISGADVTSEVRKLDNLIPIIALTAHAEPKTHTELTVSGVSRFMSKKASLTDIEKACRELYLESAFDKESARARQSHNDKDRLLTVMNAARSEIKSGRHQVAQHRLASAVAALGDENSE